MVLLPNYMEELDGRAERLIEWQADDQDDDQDDGDHDHGEDDDDQEDGGHDHGEDDDQGSGEAVEVG